MIRFAWLSLCVTSVMCAPALSQSTWEVTPYQVQVWWEVAEEPELPDNWKGMLAPDLSQRLRTQFAGVCETTVVRAPEGIRLALRRNLDALTREQLMKVAPELSKVDKLFMVVVDSRRQTYTIQVREFDSLLTHLGPVDRQADTELKQVVPRITQMITQGFSPVVRIDRAPGGDIAKTKLRARLLMRKHDSPGTLREGDVLLPYDRKVSSSGKAALGTTRPIDWTYLQVQSTAVEKGYLELNIVSGYRQPFRSKRSRRQQQYAIRTRPLTDQTRIRLLSRTAKEPLAGYEIHEKGKMKTQFLGYTNFRGELEIPPNDISIRILLVRSGQRVLAKLPIVPGLRPEVLAFLRDNRQRVEADGFLTGVHMAIIDLVAQRETLTTRIRGRIADKEFERAEELIDEFRKLPTQRDLSNQISRQIVQLNLDSSDDRLRTQVNTTVADTTRTLGKFLDANRVRELETELHQARQQQ